MTAQMGRGLLPNRRYTYTLTPSTGPFTDRLSATIQTMDTTNHDRVFDPPVLLGDGNSSVLYDIAIINDTLVFATGAIYKRDSLGNWGPILYNLARWDGRG
jgi:hypothetical protein